MQTESRITPADIAAGIALRAERRRLRLSQKAVGKPIGVTFQQIQKYERGLNRISVSRLVEMEDTTGIDAFAILIAARRALKKDKLIVTYPIGNRHKTRELRFVDMMDAMKFGRRLAKRFLGVTFYVTQG